MKLASWIIPGAKVKAKPESGLSLCTGKVLKILSFVTKDQWVTVVLEDPDRKEGPIYYVRPRESECFEVCNSGATRKCSVCQLELYSTEAKCYWCGN